MSTAAATAAIGVANEREIQPYQLSLEQLRYQSIKVTRLYLYAIIFTINEWSSVTKWLLK